MSPRPLALIALIAAALALTPADAAAAPRARLAIVLPLRVNTAGLAAFAAAVSTPGSPDYRHYRSIAWLARHFGASPAAEARVVRYLRSHGASRVRVDATGLFIDARLPAATAATLFRTRLIRRGARTGAFTAPTTVPRLPAALAGAVSGVIGLDSQPLQLAPAFTHAAPPWTRVSGLTSSWTAPAGAFHDAFTSLRAPVAHPAQATGSGYSPASGTASGCPAATIVGGFTPNEYLTAYGFSGVQATGTLGQGERVALIEIDGFRSSDITNFAHCFGLHVPPIVAFRVSRQVAATGLPPGGEATLDLEVLDAAAPDLSQIDVYESSPSIASVLESFTAPLQNSGYKPEVISASLGLCEAQVRSAIGLAGLRNAEAAFEEAAASGISVLAATGDTGSADCTNSNSPGGTPIPELAVNYPASSPFVTAVGGTNIHLNPANQIVSQPVWNDDASQPGSAGGGGFSSVFTRPRYQSGVVRENRRAVPDVALLADIAPGYDVYCSAQSDCISPLNGQLDPWQAVGGTSASTPLMAGGVALIDQLLREHRQQSLGLLNPLLYRLGETPSTAAQVFSDVTVGSNDVGPFIQADHQPLGCCNAGPGYDEASGWGSVNLAGLAAAALASEPAIVDVSQTVPTPQRPLRQRALVDEVRCSGRCVIGAIAHIQIGRSRPVTFYSGLAHLAAAAGRRLRIPLSPPELRRLRVALKQRRRIRATVVGAIVDAAGNIERRTSAVPVTLLG
ncbi:protease pro-enzyme activation domain-containing protein [Conexibacter sp. DBS9H8]|uniref:S53 family peptidase n=1 Tax=Conexibacter sp. DBS9H8 TaxID=2937801 RepID=UPI00200E3689|nr:S53 family peptidase [Conexibacter sp. DBS9H8]